MLNFVITKFISLINEVLVISNRERIASVSVKSFIFNHSVFNDTRLVKLIDWISRAFLTSRDVWQFMSFLDVDDDDELDDSKKSDLVISRSRCLNKLNESTIVEISRRIFTSNESMIKSTIHETSRRFTWKQAFVFSVILHRDVARVRKSKTFKW